MFDKDAFLSATIAEANSTTLKPCPEGEYPFVVKDIKARTGTIGKGERAGEEWAGLDVICSCEDPSVASALGRQEVNVKKGLFLDLTPTGMLDMSEGKNIDLGRFREALGQNKAGQSWSPNMMVGARFRGIVAHRLDPNDSSKVYDEIKGVRAI